MDTTVWRLDCLGDRSSEQFTVHLFSKTNAEKFVRHCTDIARYRVTPLRVPMRSMEVDDAYRHERTLRTVLRRIGG